MKIQIIYPQLKLVDSISSIEETFQNLQVSH